MGRASRYLKALFTRKATRAASQDPPPPPPSPPTPPPTHQEQGVEGHRKEIERLASAIASPIDMDKLFKQAQVERSPSRESSLDEFLEVLGGAVPPPPRQLSFSAIDMMV